MEYAPDGIHDAVENAGEIEAKQRKPQPADRQTGRGSLGGFYAPMNSLLALTGGISMPVSH